MLEPKNLLITIGLMVIVIACLGMANSEQWAEWAWDDEPVGEHDAAYEQMWALHMVPLGIMAIGTGLFVKGKPLAQMSVLTSAAILVVIGGGMMGYMVGKHGYDGTPPVAWMIIPILAMLLTLVLGIVGFSKLKEFNSETEM
ncbi:MAG: Uncharacterised protein [Candidatus Poseidoniaceae archaeon]|nr:MAG: Uncharacterised protein [Candidatus Poseidoniaceae archaeon]